MPSERELDTATRTLFGEARGEALLGKQAVAWVFRNRLEAGKWGPDLENVCTAPYQFSCWLTKDPNRAKMLALSATDIEYQNLREVVRSVFAGEIDDPTSSANHYRVKGSPAAWASGQIPVFETGAHEFFRL